MNRLLNRTLAYYSAFAAVILLLSTPALYFMMQKLYADDIDEAIYLRKAEFEARIRPTLTIRDIATWNRFNRDIRILPDTVRTAPMDRIVEQVFYDDMIPEWEPYRVLYTPVRIEGQVYVLMIQLNLVESEDLVRTIISLYVGLLATLLVVIFFITRFISNRVWRPFYQTLEAIRHFQLEDQHPLTLPPATIKEFALLNERVEKLISGSLQAYASQKKFTQNAAHELQTPLAVIQSKLDLMLQDQSLTESQSVILQRLYEAVSRLARITRNLLLLARIENRQFSETNQVSLQTVMEAAIPYFSEQADQKQIRISTRFGSPLVVEANSTLSEILVHNLLLNSIRHTAAKGEVELSTAARTLVVANTGTAPLAPEGLFKRFSHSPDNSQGSGLGLAIVQEICDRYGWKVSYHFENGRHFFTVAC